MLKFAHLSGILLVAAGLFAALFQDFLYRRSTVRSSQTMSLKLMLDWYTFFALPGAAIVFASGGALVAVYYGPLDLLNTPWLAGMFGLFTIGLVRGITVSGPYLRGLIAMTEADSQASGPETLPGRHLPVFVRGLEVPFLFLIVALGVFRPETWTMVLVGIGLALQFTFALTLLLPSITARSDDCLQ
nr:DUF2269 family protein [Roseibium sp.]